MVIYGFVFSLVSRDTHCFCASFDPELWSVLNPNTHIPSISALLTLFNIATASLTLSFLPSAANCLPEITQSYRRDK